jgi:hypothetical protein
LIASGNDTGSRCRFHAATIAPCSLINQNRPRWR